MDSSSRLHPPLLPEDIDHVLQHMACAWDELRGQTIFVTGGTGFFGRWLLETFVAANARFRLNARLLVLSRNPRRCGEQMPHLRAADAIQWIQGDVRDFVFPEEPCSHVIHAATDTVVPRPQGGPWPEHLSTIVDGTRRVLEFAAATGAAKVLYVSSGAVYGPQPSAITHLPEDYGGGPNPLEESAWYGEGKRLAELLCAQSRRSSKIEIKIARPFAFIGPHLPLDAHFAIGNFLRDALAGETITVRGDGTPFRSYLHAADLAIWLWTILFRGHDGRAYNVGSGDARPISSMAQAVAAELGSPPPVVLGVAKQPAAPPSRYVPDVSRASLELGLAERIPLAESIRRTARWHRLAQARTAKAA
ncbi:MAG TPA: NAD(P)-dependent oxidoreductase [Opitutaceae bacterium]|jgi:dTDP-glucose 4,6-dehydratase